MDGIVVDVAFVHRTAAPCCYNATYLMLLKCFCQYSCCCSFLASVAADLYCAASPVFLPVQFFVFDSALDDVLNLSAVALVVSTIVAAAAASRTPWANHLMNLCRCYSAVP